MTCGWRWGLRVPDHPGPVLPHPTRRLNSGGRQQGWNAAVSRAAAKAALRDCWAQTAASSPPNGGGAQWEGPEMFTADLTEGRAVSGDPGAGHSRAVPSRACRARAPPTRGTLTAWLAALLGAAGPGATSRGAGGGLRPRGARSSAPCPRRKGRATSRRHLRSRVTFPALPRPSDPGIPARANHPRAPAHAPPRPCSNQ